MIFDRGVHVCWKTLDGIVHEGVVKQVVRDWHIIQEEGEPFSKYIPTAICVEKSKKQVKKHG